MASCVFTEGVVESTLKICFTVKVLALHPSLSTASRASLSAAAPKFFTSVALSASERGRAAAVVPLLPLPAEATAAAAVGLFNGKRAHNQEERIRGTPGIEQHVIACREANNFLI